MKYFVRTALVLALGTGSALPALAGDKGHAHEATPTTQTTAAELTDGEIKKVNKDTGKLTIKHGELKNLGMAPMTMLFRVKDAALLDQVKAGDKISFAADKVNGQLVVTQLEVRK